MPKGSILLRPKARQPAAARDGLNSFPKQRTELLFLFGMKERFTMNLALLSLNFQRDGADERSIRANHQLKVGQALLQIEGWQPGHSPKGDQPSQIVQRCPTNLMTGRTHFGESLPALPVAVKFLVAGLARASR